MNLENPEKILKRLNLVYTIFTSSMFVFLLISLICIHYKGCILKIETIYIIIIYSIAIIVSLSTIIISKLICLKKTKNLQNNKEFLTRFNLYGTCQINNLVVIELSILFTILLYLIFGEILIFIYTIILASYLLFNRHTIDKILLEFPMSKK